MYQRTAEKFSLGIAAALLVAACGGQATTTTVATTGTTTGGGATTSTTEATETTPVPEELPVVRLSALSGGLTGVALTVIEENGFDEANGFQGEFFYNDPDASGQFFLQRNSDVAFDFDAIGAAIARSEDLDLSVFYPILNNNNCIVVKEDATYQSPEDLVGLKVGHFGADSGTTTSFTIIIKALFGFNLLEDYELVETGPPALVELLKDDEVEAIFDFVPHATRAIVQVPGRCMFGPVAQVTGQLPGGVNSHLSEMAAYNDWLDENPDLAQAVMAAWDDAYAWLTEDPTRITEDPYRSLLGQDDPAVLAAVAEAVTAIPLFTNDWSAEVQAGVEAWVDLAAAQGVLIEENPGGVVRSVGN